MGGRSVANSAIKQYAEVRDDEDKFMRLLQLLGVWYERGHVLVFVDTQARCDRLYEDLLRVGYPCLSLHGGKEQIDRDQTIADFKNKVCTLMVATSVAGRGLDVPDLRCVINYYCPNHLEDYVHRVGRTGRAGREGTAYTFITPHEEQFAPILVKALKQAEQEIPEDLQKLADTFRAKIDSGQAKWASYGYGGSGFKFDHTEKNEAQKLADMQRKAYEIEHGLRDPADFSDEMESEDEEELTEQELEDKLVAEKARARAEALVSTSTASGEPVSSTALTMSTSESPLERAKRMAAELAGGGQGAMVVAKPPPAVNVQNALARAKEMAAILGRNGVVPGSAGGGHFTGELEINDYPQKARYRVTHRDVIDDVSEKFSVAIISRGSYIPPGKKTEEKKL